MVAVDDKARVEPGEYEGCFRICGELTFETVPRLWRSSQGLFENCEQVVMDLSQVSRADSAGLALLIDWTRQARKSDQEVSLIHMPKQILDIVRVSGLDNVLPFYLESGPLSSQAEGQQS